jgi:tetratricopeptide (TPR) repeat protein
VWLSGTVVLAAAVLLTGCALFGGSVKGRGGETPQPAGEDAPVKLTRSSMKEARADIAEGNLKDAFRIYQAVLDTTHADDARRPEALYWTGLLRLSSEPSLRDVEKARAALRSVAAAYPASDRSYESVLALTLLSEIDAGRAAVAAEEGKVAQANLAAETCRGETQQLNQRVLDGVEESRALRSDLAARRNEIELLRQEVRRKDEAIQKIKEAVVGWKPSR